MSMGWGGPRIRGMLGHWRPAAYKAGPDPRVGRASEADGIPLGWKAMSAVLKESVAQ